MGALFDSDRVIGMLYLVRYSLLCGGDRAHADWALCFAVEADFFEIGAAGGLEEISKFVGAISE